MWGWIARLAGLLTGFPLGRIFDSIDRGIDSETERQRIKAEMATAYFEARVSALAATQAFAWYHPQFLIGYAVAIFVTKLLVWDTVFGLGVTPDPGPFVRWIAVTVIGFYFLPVAASAIAGGIGRRRQ